jgi:hypothetical protein
MDWMTAIRTMSQALPNRSKNVLEADQLVR